MADSKDARQSLASRIIPKMTFSDGSLASMTGAPPPMPHYLAAEGRALKRFAVEGNAIFTGGGGTLALATARALLEHGLSGLALFDVHFTPAALEDVASLRRDFPSARIVRDDTVNVTAAENLERAITRATRELSGGVDILCSFAGVVGNVHAVDMSPDGWRRILDVNTTGSFLSSQAVARHMIARNTPGSIVLVASISAHTVNYPQPQAAYNASKAALLSLKSSLAAEWAVHGIRVNSISPGYMDTVLNEGPGLEESRRVWRDRNPMGRMGSPEELTGAVVLLCSQAGSYMTGMDLRIDGGQCCI
ncbi:MAG: hypothetical protein Q9163_002529 [Psora crenata]